jgi:UDP-2-acetamido-3-amino-2,3-dideoxy-glucuronate N-acetyltransferase
VPDYGLIVGVPGRRSGWACECGEVLPEFQDETKCPRCERDYRIHEGLLQPGGKG